MKTLSALIVMLLISFTLSETAYGGSDLKKGPQKFSKNSIESLIVGLNSDNKGVIIGCAILAGEYKITETVEHLAKILNSDLSYDVKTAAVYSLYQIQNKEALIALKKACTKNNCPFLKQSAEVFLNHYLICNPDKEVKLEENYLATE
jgi:hypothetical protein